jgi:hypothetical protein
MIAKKFHYSIFMSAVFVIALLFLTSNIVMAKMEEQASLKKIYETLEENFKALERKKNSACESECYFNRRVLGENISECFDKCEIQHLKRTICFLKKNSNMPESFSEIECHNSNN